MRTDVADSAASEAAWRPCRVSRVSVSADRHDAQRRPEDVATGDGADGRRAVPVVLPVVRGRDLVCDCPRCGLEGDVALHAAGADVPSAGGQCPTEPAVLRAVRGADVDGVRAPDLPDRYAGS